MCTYYEPYAGDVLVLTKALGTGVILAGDMRSKAKSRWVEAAIASMLASNLTAARIINDASHRCSALTDITGFGLIGHLLEMITASQEQVGVELLIDQVIIGRHNMTDTLGMNFCCV